MLSTNSDNNNQLWHLTNNQVLITSKSLITIVSLPDRDAPGATPSATSGHLLQVILNLPGDRCASRDMNRGSSRVETWAAGAQVDSHGLGFQLATEVAVGTTMHLVISAD